MSKLVSTTYNIEDAFTPSESNGAHHPDKPPKSPTVHFSDVVGTTPPLEVATSNLPATTTPPPSAEVKAHAIPNTILVPLVHRENELRELMRRNRDFYGLLHHHLTSRSEEAWQEFKSVLYAKRELMPDREWIQEIERFLDSTPSILIKLKELIGYEEDEEEPDSAEVSEDDEGDLVKPGHKVPQHDNIELCCIRAYPNRVATLQPRYRQFFFMAKACLSQNEIPGITSRRGSHVHPSVFLQRVQEGETPSDSEMSDILDELEARAQEHQTQRFQDDDEETRQYREFINVLTTPRRDMSDNAWEQSVEDSLEHWPALLKQLREIVEREVQDARATDTQVE
ncbi:hypothetical protein BZG36_04019 [Bifiguratus adelaidae]|uniref:Uncharacterized protein n=1 Tax=Bifiguratus adelaidae TaxID=1938954 RepID=A0A261XZ15_9FUNG|nr:hypothetical protein BZG36_04019 [Bifiguratus adelaidae]